jgi:Uma2 family endonuclease
MHNTYDDYLALEEESPTRHEYLDGKICAILSSTPDHAALAAAILSIIGQQLPRGCRAFTSNLRLRIPSIGLSPYPDGTVICGKSQRAADDPIAITNPTILIEVTSNSTEDYDRSLKLRHYQTIPTLGEILIISHREPRMTLHRRTDNGGWTATEAGAGESLPLQSIGGAIRVDDVYRDGLEDTGR